jgi:hypothetical protein
LGEAGAHFCFFLFSFFWRLGDGVGEVAPSLEGGLEVVKRWWFFWRRQRRRRRVDGGGVGGRRVVMTSFWMVDRSFSSVGREGDLSNMEDRLERDPSAKAKTYERRLLLICWEYSRTEVEPRQPWR